MTHFLQRGFLLVNLVFVSSVYAESTIVITLVNNSNTPLEISHISANQGAKIVASKSPIPPNGRAIIEGTIMRDVDLSGSIAFNSDAERFSMHVRRLKHFGQPSFTMQKGSLRTNVDRESLRFNNDGNPTHLAYTAATVLIEEQPNIEN